MAGTGVLYFIKPGAMVTAAFNQVFKVEKPIIGMIHVPALPGTPRYGNDDRAIRDQVLEEAEIYLEGGVDALMIENMHDVPYQNRSVGPEVTAFMAVLGQLVKSYTGLPCGLQILAGANQEALAVAKASRMDFVRAEGFVFSHVADEGWIDADAARLLRYRKQIHAEHILVFTDVKKKHSSHAITHDLDVQEMAEAAHFFLSDGVILTGGSTGKVAALEEVESVYQAQQGPVLIGSGLTAENIGQFLPFADGFIVGSWFKEGGHWANAPELKRVQQMMEVVHALRGNF